MLAKSAVMRYTDVWNDLTKKIGFWVDMDNPYVTYKTKYIESVWWLLKEIYDKGLIYKGLFGTTLFSKSWNRSKFT